MLNFGNASRRNPQVISRARFRKEPAVVQQLIFFRVMPPFAHGCQHPSEPSDVRACIEKGKGFLTTRGLDDRHSALSAQPGVSRIMVEGCEAGYSEPANHTPAVDVSH